MNAVYLVGPDNNNGLGLVRQFGKNGVKPVGIVINNSDKKRYMCASKYWSEIIVVNNEDEAITVLLTRSGSVLDEKPFVIPYSDPAADALDLQYDTLSRYYILPSINKKAGAIHYWMDKQNQAKLIEELGFKTLHTETITFDNAYPLDLNQKDYPVIWKPVSSLDGGKGDMAVIWNQEQYIEKYNRYRENGWRRILEQKYIENREELDIVGAVCSKNTFCSFSVLKKQRLWPEEYGIGSYIQCENNKVVNEYSYEFAKALSLWGYSGSFDVDMYWDKETEKLYIGEINWRPSEKNWVSIFQNTYSSYYWTLNESGIRNDETVERKKIQTAIDENFDYFYVTSNRISFFQWLKDFIKADAYAILDKEDFKPAMIEYREMMKQVIFTMLSQITLLRKMVDAVKHRSERV